MDIINYFFMLGCFNSMIFISALAIIIISKHKKTASTTRLFPKQMQTIFLCSAILSGLGYSVPLFNLDKAISSQLLFIIICLSMHISMIIGIRFMALTQVMMNIAILLDDTDNKFLLDRTLRNKLEKKEWYYKNRKTNRIKSFRSRSGSQGRIKWQRLHICRFGWSE